MRVTVDKNKEGVVERMLAMAFLKYLLLAAYAALCVALPAQQFKKQSSTGVNSTGIGGTYGCDLSTAFSQSDFQCLKSQGYDFAIIRAYRSTGSPDPNAKSSIDNARAAGIEYVDVYMFPCPTCGNPSGQVKDMVDSLSGSNYDQIWLDIEGPEYWMESESSNQAFFEELLRTAQAYGTTGVYTSDSQWNPIMGSGYNGGSSAQLWYAHYDGDPSFSDFSSFGGWSRPTIKQYAGDASVCGVDIDKDWY